MTGMQACGEGGIGAPGNRCMALEETMRSVGEAVRPAIAGAMALHERWRSGVGYNPLSARMVQDPYPLYAALRARSPVHRSTLLNAWCCLPD